MKTNQSDYQHSVPPTSYTLNQWCILIFGILCYLLVNGTLFYLIGFVGGFGVPKSIDDGQSVSLFIALVTDIGLILLFGLQHSIMARESYKKWLSKQLSPALQRSCFVLSSVFLLILLFWQWRPLPEIIWEVNHLFFRIFLYSLFAIGWVIMLFATYLIDHYELFGVRQVLLHLKGQHFIPLRFKTPLLYQYVRHPMMLGFLIGFWATPDMTLGHLVLSLGMSLYILIGIFYEEKDLIRHFGKKYLLYQCLTPRLMPSLRKFSKKKNILKSLR